MPGPAFRAKYEYIAASGALPGAEVLRVVIARWRMRAW